MPGASHWVRCWNAEMTVSPCCSRRYSSREKLAKRGDAYCATGKSGIDSAQWGKGAQVALKQTVWGRAWGNMYRGPPGCSRRKNIPSKDHGRDHMRKTEISWDVRSEGCEQERVQEWGWRGARAWLIMPRRGNDFLQEPRHHWKAPGSFT